MIDKYKHIIITAIITSLIFVMIFGFKSCNNDADGKTVFVNGKPYKLIKHVSDTQYVVVNKSVYRDGTTIYKDTVIYITIPSVVDTIEVLKNYYSKVVYTDTLKLDDKLGHVYVKDTLFKNNILNRKWVASINKTIIKDSFFLVELPKREFFVGGGITYNKTLYLGPSIMFKTKKENIYNINVGLGMDKSMTYGFGFVKKLKF